MAANDPSKQPPQIPSFKKEDKEKKGGAIPLLGQGGKPALTIRGMGHGTTLMERLKQFKKKDMAFIASGLAVLLMAPIAEHFFLGPKDDPNTLKRGFDAKGNLFTDVSPYEPGTGGMSPGGLAGANQDIITPLNVRDPASLIMGPGATQTPSTTVSAPTTPSKSDSGGWKDALVEAAKGSRDSGLPGPRGNMAGALRGLSALAGSSYGGGPSYGLPPISASNVPNRGADSSALSRVQGAPGFKGVAERGPGAGSNTLEALKRAGADQAGLFNRAGSAGANLDQAAAAAIPGGGGIGSDLGGPGGGEANKAPGGNQGKDSKSLGESLAFLRAKMNMEKELELYWKKREFKEFELQKILYTELLKLGITNLAGKAFLEPAGQAMAQFVFCGWGEFSQRLATCQQAVFLTGGVHCTEVSDGSRDFYANQNGVVWTCNGNEAIGNPTSAPKDGGSPFFNKLPCPGCKVFGGSKKYSGDVDGPSGTKTGAPTMEGIEQTANAFKKRNAKCRFGTETGEPCTVIRLLNEMADMHPGVKTEYDAASKHLTNALAALVKALNSPNEYSAFASGMKDVVISLHNDDGGPIDSRTLQIGPIAKIFREVRGDSPKSIELLQRAGEVMEVNDVPIRHNLLMKGPQEASSGIIYDSGHPALVHLARGRTAVAEAIKEHAAAQQRISKAEVIMTQMGAKMDQAEATYRSAEATASKETMEGLKAEMDVSRSKIFLASRANFEQVQKISQVMIGKRLEMMKALDPIPSNDGSFTMKLVKMVQDQSMFAKQITKMDPVNNKDNTYKAIDQFGDRNAITQLNEAITQYATAVKQAWDAGVGESPLPAPAPTSVTPREAPGKPAAQAPSGGQQTVDPGAVQ